MTEEHDPLRDPKAPVRILHVDDNAQDRDLVRDAMEQAPRIYDICEARTQAEFERHLRDQHFDLILSDFNILGFEGLDVLETVARRCPDTPVIIVTGTGSEETAVRALKNGAADYVVKTPHHIRHLPFTVESVLEKARLRSAEQALNEQLDLITTHNVDGILLLDDAGTVLFANPAASSILGRQREALVGSNFGVAVAVGAPTKIDIPRADGAVSTVEIRTTRTTWGGRDAQLASLRDITELKNAMVQVEHLNAVLQAIRSINQLIVREHDPDRLIQQACTELVAARGCRGSWIALGDGTGPATDIAGASLDEGFTHLTRALSEGHWPECTVEAAAIDGCHLVPPESTACSGCPLGESHHRGTAAVVALRHAKRTFGFLCVSFPQTTTVSPDERGLLFEIASDLAFALQSIETRRLREESEVRLESAVEGGRVGLWEWNPTTNDVFFSEEWKAQIGYSDDELPNRYEEWAQRVHPDDLPATLDRIRRAVESPDQHYESEFRLLHRDGSYRWILARGTVHLAEDGTPSRILGTHIDITDRRREEEHHRRAQQVARIGHWELSSPTAAPTWSDEVFRIFSLEPGSSEPSFTEHDQIIHPEEWPLLEAAVRAGFDEALPFDLILRILRPDDQIGWLHAIGTPEVDDNGQVLRLFGTAQDITALKSAELELTEQERLLRGISDNMLDMVSTADLEGRFTYASPSHLQLGYEPSALIGLQITELVHPDDLELVLDRLSTILTDGGPTSAEFRYLRADGTYAWLGSIGKTMLDSADQPTGVIVCSRDITQLKQSQQLLVEEKERAQLYLDVAAVMLLALDGEGRVSMINRRGCEIMGIDNPHEIVGSTWIDFIPDEQRDDVREIYRHLLAGHTDNHETVEGSVLTFTGDTKQILWHNAVIYDGQGNISGTLSSGEDVTEQRLTEQALAESESLLQQAQRMEAVGRLAGGIAHDFNNLLMIINNRAEIITRQLHKDDPLYQKTSQILDAGERAAKLTSQLLAFSRRQIMDPAVVSLNEVVTSLEVLLRRLIGEDIELRCVCGDDLGLIKADPSQLEQVLMNLAVNARDAMPNGGCLTIETANVDLDAPYTSTPPEATPGPHVMLAVTDNGIGMDQPTRLRIFEPFFTTKESGRGTGLGLAMVYGIVHQSGGTIRVDSEPDRGTTFRIYLPRVEGVRSQRGAASDEMDLGGSETVLVVEDEDAVRELIAELLSDAGYTVIQAANGGEALLKCEERSGEIDIVLTDVVMPRMSGKVLVDRLTELYPSLKVLYMSGYTENAIVHHGILDDSIAFLSKPFTAGDLTRSIRQALDAETD